VVGVGDGVSGTGLTTITLGEGLGDGGRQAGSVLKKSQVGVGDGVGESSMMGLAVGEWVALAAGAFGSAARAGAVRRVDTAATRETEARMAASSRRPRRALVALDGAMVEGRVYG